MASDEKTLRIEANFNEESQTAGDKLRSESPESVRDQIKEFIKTVLTGEDEPLFTKTETPFTPTEGPPGAIDQLPLDKAFPEEKTEQDAKVALDEETIREFQKLFEEFGITVKSSVGQTAGSTLGGTASAGRVGTVAGGTAATAGRVAGTAGTTATTAGGATTLGGAVTATAGTLLGVATAATAVALAFTGLTMVLAGLTKLLDSLYQSLTSEFSPVSPHMQVAEARAEAELLLHRLKTAQDVQRTAAEATAVRTEVQKEWMELRATISEIIAPVLITMMEILEAMLAVVNVIAIILKWMVYPFNLMASGITWLLRWVKARFGYPDLPEENEYTKFQEDVVENFTRMDSFYHGEPSRRRFTGAEGRGQAHAGMSGRFYGSP